MVNMTLQEKKYYTEMEKLDRLIPVIDINEKYVGLITYILCKNLNEVDSKDPFTPMFSSEGRICYIEQLIFKYQVSMQESLSIFKCLLDIIQKKHPEVEVIFWKRYNKHTGKLKLHIYNLKKEKSYVYN